MLRTFTVKKEGDVFRMFVDIFPTVESNVYLIAEPISYRVHRPYEVETSEAWLEMEREDIEDLIKKLQNALEEK